jgi:hypothetical protein
MVHALPAMRPKVRPGTAVNGWGIRESARWAVRDLEAAKDELRCGFGQKRTDIDVAAVVGSWLR